LRQQADSEAAPLTLDGLTPREQLRRVRVAVGAMVAAQHCCWQEELVPLLAREGLVFRPTQELDAAELAWVRRHFSEQVQPVLTPLAVDQAHPFPLLGNKTLSLLVLLRQEEDPAAEPVLSIVPVPRSLPRILRLCPGEPGPDRFLFLSEILKLCVGELFPGYRVLGAHAFRVTRNSDLYIDEEEAENLLKKIEDELRNLRRGAAVRLEVENGVDPWALAELVRHLGLPEDAVYAQPAPLNFLRLMALHDLVDRPDLKYPPFTGADCAALSGGRPVFDAIRERDLLLHHPYDSFSPVVTFVQEAARDPEVLAIKQTLYRTSGDSPIIEALIEASLAGKQVTALVELMARFDEANNIKWARELEEAGVHVVYGVVGHKTHCKCCLVVRREGGILRRYVHLGTGNYNPRTARLYTDLSLLTARESLTAEVAQLFNSLTGLGRAPEFHHLLVAPFNLHARILELIAAETAHARAGRPARIIAKMNKLVDPHAIEALYAASRAGVQIDLIIRSTCCLVPGVKGQSENIRLRNLVGRFLEHARIFVFGQGGNPAVYAGSADWMPRNFFRRVEAVFPVEDPVLRHRILDEILASELRDTVDAAGLRSDGTYASLVPAEGAAPFQAQRHFMTLAQARTAAAAP
jgi:polyphosphate kinase